MTSLRVLVKGAIPEEDFYNDPENRSDFPAGKTYAQFKAEFIGACRAIGRALAMSEHTIMVGVPHWDRLRTGVTVASYVILGYHENEHEDKRDVTFFAPKEPEPPDETSDVKDTIQEFNNLDNIRIRERFLEHGPTSAMMIPGVADADAVILIGGGEGSESIGYAAYALGKPIVGVTRFQGAAKLITETLVFDKYLRSSGIPVEDLRILQREWKPWDEQQEAESPERKANLDIAIGVVDLIQKLNRVSVDRDKRTRRMLRGTVLIINSLILAWLLVFLGGAALKQEPFMLSLAFFIQLFLAATIGTGLRVLVQYQTGRLVRLAGMQLFVEITISLIVAFGLALLYLIGGISFTGEIVVLGTGSGEGSVNTFATVAVTMSLIGLASGYLMPLTTLREQLERFLEGDED